MCDALMSEGADANRTGKGIPLAEHLDGDGVREVLQVGKTAQLELHRVELVAVLGRLGTLDVVKSGRCKHLLCVCLVVSHASWLLHIEQY